ncbi:MAG TPA: hypothetical protein VN890_02670, partial [Methylocella sp.]|nr:hypothetical protein [Methylocella sp.]
MTFSLHQSGEKQGFLLDEIAITVSVVKAAIRREKAAATTSCHVCTANALKTRCVIAQCAREKTFLQLIE